MLTVLKPNTEYVMSMKSGMPVMLMRFCQFSYPAFTQVFLLQNGSAEVGQITSEEVPNATDSDIKCQKKSFPIYQVKDTVILQCTESVLPEFTYQFVQQVCHLR